MEQGSRTRSIGGQRATAAGKDFEQLVEMQLKIGEHTGLVAFWAHAEPQFRMVGGKMVAGRWEPRFMPCGAGFADYSGLLTGGMAFALECKSTRERRFPRSKISEEQVHHLDAVANAGGLALLALQFYDEERRERTAFLEEWLQVPWRKLRSADTVGAEDLEQLGSTMRRPRALERFVKQCAGCRLVTHQSGPYANMVRPACRTCLGLAAA